MNSRTHQGLNTTNQNFERGSRFIPVQSNPLVFRNDPSYAVTGSPIRGGSRTPPSSNNWVALNEGMFFMHPQGQRSNSIEDSGSGSDEHKGSSHSSPISPHQEVIANALGVPSSNRVYELTSGTKSDVALDLYSTEKEKRSRHLELADSLAVSPSSQKTRRYLASRPGTSPSTPKKKPMILSMPKHNLEAPGLKDDFYCNVTSWSALSNRIAVGLHNSVYTWSTDNDVMLIHQDHTATITAVKYSNDDYIAIGKDNGLIVLVSQLQNESKAVYHNNGKSVFCFAWMPDSKLFFAGDSNGDVKCLKVEETPDGRMELILVCKIECHQQQVCGNYYFEKCQT